MRSYDYHRVSQQPGRSRDRNHNNNTQTFSHVKDGYVVDVMIITGSHSSLQPGRLRDRNHNNNTQTFSHVKDGYVVDVMIITGSHSSLRPGRLWERNYTNNKQTFSHVKDGYVVDVMIITGSHSGLVGRLRGRRYDYHRVSQRPGRLWERNYTNNKQTFSHVKDGYVVDVMIITGSHSGLQPSRLRDRNHTNNTQTFTHVKDGYVSEVMIITGSHSGLAVNHIDPVKCRPRRRPLVQVGPSYLLRQPYKYTIDSTDTRDNPISTTPPA
ncbi:hypothetical protein J6590_005770 [Homalodisca vitripennis]|nr:hypothetical protein J6590_005770 [Homalodisca vitripennis]